MSTFEAGGGATIGAQSAFVLTSCLADKEEVVGDDDADVEKFDFACVLLLLLKRDAAVLVDAAAAANKSLACMGK